jgi:hypothetical protein
MQIFGVVAATIAVIFRKMTNLCFFLGEGNVYDEYFPVRILSFSIAKTEVCGGAVSELQGERGGAW